MAPAHDDGSGRQPPSLAKALYDRRDEYTGPRRLRIKVGTWNVAGLPDTYLDLARWFVDEPPTENKGGGKKNGNGKQKSNGHERGGDADDVADDHDHDDHEDHDDDHDDEDDESIGLYVLCLQEIVDLSDTREYAYADPLKRQKWTETARAALPGHRLIVDEQMTGVLLLVLARPDVVVGAISTSSVGTGLLGYMGNKGAIGARLLLGETTRLVFVGCHLAHGSDQTVRRIWDAETIRTRMKFEPAETQLPVLPVPGAGRGDGAGGGDADADEAATLPPPPAAPPAYEQIGDEDVAFWFGDLNFRIDDVPGDQIRHLLQKVCWGEYEAGPDDDDHDGGTSGNNHGGDEDGDDAPLSETEFVSLQSPNTFEVGHDDEDEDADEGWDTAPAADDPASLQSVLQPLLAHDQLLRLIRQRRLFHDGWREGPITFMPTYKYDIGTLSKFDTSAKRRAPSWCDRILTRTKSDRDGWNTRLREEEEARKRDEEMRARGIDKAAEEDDDLLFEYDPGKDGGDSDDGGGGAYQLDQDDANQRDGEDEGERDPARSHHVFLTRHSYRSHHRISSSDHKPVSALFTLEYYGVAPKRKATIHAEVIRDLDRRENEGKPAVTVVGDSGEDPPSVDLGSVGYRTSHLSTLTVANTGRVSARCSFLDGYELPPGSTLGPGGSGSDSGVRWLTTSFIDPASPGADGSGGGDYSAKSVTIEPGDTATAQVRALVEDVELVRQLNGGENLEDVLVLRIEDGKDHFVPVRGAWVATSFGRSVEELVRMPEQGGARVLDPAQPASHLPVQAPAPEELRMLCEAIRSLAVTASAAPAAVDDEEHGGGDDDSERADGIATLRNTPAWPLERRLVLDPEVLSRGIGRVTDALDTHSAAILDSLGVEDDLAPAARLEIAFQALVSFLGGIRDGIIPPHLWAELPQLASSTSALTRDAILDALRTSPHHHISFLYLTDALSDLCAALAPRKRPADPPAPKRFRTFSLKRGEGATWGSPEAGGNGREREKRIAAALGTLVCPVGEDKAKGKEREAQMERARSVLEVCISGRGGQGSKGRE